MPVGLPRHRPYLLAALCAATAVIVASCNDRPPAGSGPPPVSIGPTTSPTTRPTPISLDPNAALLPQAIADLGFTFAPAPATARTPDDVLAANRTCLACHGPGDALTMHRTDVGLSCIDCHGGFARADVPADIGTRDPRSEAYLRAKRQAHVTPKLPEIWKSENALNPLVRQDPLALSAANPKTPYTATLAESPDFIRFVNPGDLRAARAACASCHADEVSKVHSSMMTHGAMLWGAALYNNGSINRKNPVYGEFYDAAGKPAGMVADPLPTTRQADLNGVLSALWPLPRWEVTQPGNVLRVFERGGKFRPALGVPETKEDAGRPDVKLSVRGFGTDVRTDPVFIGLQKTRLLDPTLNMFGTNDHPGDYRAGGCSACHVVYANDRSPVHSGLWANFGNRGESFSNDPTVNPIAKGTTQPTTEAPADAYADKGPGRERGHPIRHEMVKQMPTSSCISCHIHPGTNVVNSYLGYLWWDNETDGRLMYPARQQYPTPEDELAVNRHNPEGSAVRGLWSNRFPNETDHLGNKAGEQFLERVGTPEFNRRLTRTQFADFHGHGWIYRAVFKQNRRGEMLDHAGNVVPDVSADTMRRAVEYTRDETRSPADDRKLRDQIPVHLKDIHLERGMQCVDCHFKQDAHGDGNLYGETRNAVQIECVDCHGTVDAPAKIFSYLTAKDRDSAAGRALLAGAFSGNAAPKDPDEMALAERKKFLTMRFRAQGGRLIQKSATRDGQSWTVVQTNETVTPVSAWRKAMADDAGTAKRAELARYAHTVRRHAPSDPGSPKWGGDVTAKPTAECPETAHSTLSCYACHTSWNTSCFGCHLPQRANFKKPMLHNEGLFTRNYTSYNFQTLRDDVYMLGIDSTSKNHKVVPIRSACAVLVSSQDANRQWVYSQQQTISAEGFSGTAFSPYFPHTVRAAETKQCNDCHLSPERDNNAVMAQLLLQGTNAVNFLGRFAWVGEGKDGLEAVAVTERDEPQAVIGSTLHRLAYPDDFKKHAGRSGQLAEAHHHHGHVLDLQLRGEYLYAACGEDGFIAYDVANIDNKGFSERIVTAPVSPLGQRLYVKSKYATSICSPSTTAIDPTRPHLTVREKLSDGTERTVRPNEEQDVHPLYAYLYLTDRDEGLIVIGNPAGSPDKPGVATLLDGDPENNFLQRAVTFNPNGLLKGARHLALHGTYAYVSCDAGLVVVDLNDPLRPRHVPTPQLAGLSKPRKVAFQFRYGFVCDALGVRVIDVTFPDRPTLVRDKAGRSVTVPILDPRDIYLSRTYGFVAAGREGLVILDLEKPEEPRWMSGTRDFPNDVNAAAGINDATAVRIGMTNASMFAYVADGRNGLRVLQLTSPEDTPTYLGYSPRLSPRLVATYKTHGPAIALSEGLDRDRAVDEAGHQLSVFGRRGARPFNLAEQQRLYLRTNERGERVPYTVSNTPEPAGKLPEAAAQAPSAPTPTQAPPERLPGRPPPRRR